MFFIFNKDKVMSYIVTVFTVAILFFTASVFTNNKDTIQTSTNEIKTNNSSIVDNNINNILEDNEIIN